jgi:hypothetical protein
MKAILLLCALVWASALKADDTAMQVAAKSLTFLQEKGVAWIEDRECASCHQVPSMLWSLNSARRSGLAVDGKDLAERTVWAADWRHWNNPRNIPANADKAAAINIDTMTALLLGRDGATDGEAKWPQQFQAQLLKNQQPDGSWKPQGQLPLGKRPARETTEVTTMWALLALGGYESAAIPAEAKARAEAFLAAAQSGKSCEWHAVRLLLEPNQESRRAELLKAQHEDGGWGWVLTEPGDALGTGLAMYALARGGLPSSAEPMLRAIQFLKTTQKPDGSWAVPSTRAKDKNKVIPTASYWGTAWAVIGLLEPGLAAGKETELRQAGSGG